MNENIVELKKKIEEANAEIKSKTQKNEQLTQQLQKEQQKNIQKASSDMLALTEKIQQNTSKRVESRDRLTTIPSFEREKMVNRNSDTDSRRNARYTVLSSNEPSARMDKTLYSIYHHNAAHHTIHNTRRDKPNSTNHRSQ